MTSTTLWKSVPQKDTHAAFPGIALLPTGELLGVWREAPKHLGGTPSKIVVARSNDGARTWQNRFVFDDTTVDFRDPSVTVSAGGGRIWLTGFNYYAAGSYDTTVEASDTGGNATTSFNELAILPDVICTAPIVEMKDGSLTLLTYGKNSPSDTYDSCQAWRSTDWGINWTRYIVANGQSAGKHFQEPTAILLRNGALLCAFRNGNNEAIGFNASWDGGVTWSAPASKFAGTGRPTILEFANGATICVYRQLTNKTAVFRVSLDRGATWGAETAFSGSTLQMDYAALVEIQPNVAAGLLSLETSGDAAALTSVYALG